MKLGIIQTKPDDPNTFEIVDQKTGEKLEDIVEYDVSEYAGGFGQCITVKVMVKRPYKSGDTNIENYK